VPQARRRLSSVLICLLLFLLTLSPAALADPQAGDEPADGTGGGVGAPAPSPATAGEGPAALDGPATPAPDLRLLEPIPGPPFGDGIVLNLAARTVRFYSNGRLLREYPCAVGKPATPTPVGEYTIICKVTDPAWHPPRGGTTVPPGPHNPLGSRWLGLSRRGYGIHGTNNPLSIGNAVSLGCIRMQEADIVELHDLVAVGLPVHLVYATAEVRVDPATGLRLLVDYPDIYGRSAARAEATAAALEQAGLAAAASAPSSDEWRQQPEAWNEWALLEGAAPPPASEARFAALGIPVYAGKELLALARPQAGEDEGGIPKGGPGGGCPGGSDPGQGESGQGDPWGDDDATVPVLGPGPHDPDPATSPLDHPGVAGALVPLRPPATAMGLALGWDPVSRRATCAGRPVDGICRQGTTYVTISYLSELLEQPPAWDTARGGVALLRPRLVVDDVAGVDDVVLDEAGEPLIGLRELATLLRLPLIFLGAERGCLLGGDHVDAWVIGGRAYSPLPAIAAALGADWRWDPAMGRADLRLRPVDIVPFHEPWREPVAPGAD